MGYPPATHHHDTQGKPPTHEDTCLTTSRPVLHEPAHDALSSMELNGPRESRPLYKRFSNSEKMLEEIEGQLFPEFDGTECPRAVRILGEEWAEGKLKALFFRVNNKLYAYVDNAARQAYGNIHMGVPPPLPPRRTMRMLEGRMGPMLLYNTVSEIRKLYARAAREEPHHTLNVQEAQDLNSYLHLWNVHKQEKSDLIHIAMKGWRPPAWAAEAVKQKKLALREKGKAQAVQQTGNSLPQHGQPSTTGTQPESSSITSPGTAPTSYPQSLRDQLVSPEPGEVVTRETATDQYPHQSSPTKLLPHATGTSSAVTAPPKRKGKGRSKPNDDLPTDAPPLSANANTWVHFMHLWQLGRTRVEDDQAWNQVFPGALRAGPIDGREVDPLPPHIRAVRGFLIVQRLMPQSQFNMGRNTWRHMAAWLFGVAGQYCSMISWAGLAPVPGGNTTWFGASDGSAYTLGCLAAYFAANGVLYEDADDLWWWGQNHLEEL